MMEQNQIVSKKEYFRITNCAGWDIKLPTFSVEEIQQYLINKGYKIVLHKAIGLVKEVVCEDNSVRETGKQWDDSRETILAIKEGDVLPERVDSKEAKEMNFLIVYEKEMKKQLMGL